MESVRILQNNATYSFLESAQLAGCQHLPLSQGNGSSSPRDYGVEDRLHKRGELFLVPRLRLQVRWQQNRPPSHRSVTKHSSSVGDLDQVTPSSQSLPDLKFLGYYFR